MRRLAIIAHYDRAGRLGGYVEHFVRHLREHVEHVVLVVNGTLSDQARDAAAALADHVVYRDNSGFDVYAYRDGFAAAGRLVHEVDEVLLLNTTFYAPVRPLAPVFEQMERADVDFWGMTDHPEVRPNPITRGPVLRRHIQTYWVAVRRRMYTSTAWRRYWSRMPEIKDYLDAVAYNEGRFTHYFESAGFRSAVAFPHSLIPVQNATMEAPELLVEAGCPIVKRRLLFHDPLHFEQQALIGRDTRIALERSGYPMELVWADMSRVARPRDVHTNMGLLEVLPDVDAGGTDPRSLRVGVLAHVFYEDMLDELLDLCDQLPGGYTLIATTPAAEKRDAIEATLRRRGRSGDEVRLIPSNRGRDISALLVGCRDVIEGDRFDVLLKIHSKRSPQAHYNQARIFKRHLFENLLHTPGYATNVLRIFADHRTLGMAFPAMIHIGYPTLGRAWLTNREPAERLADELGFDVPFDELSPVAPYGSMFFARPAALRPLLRREWDWEDFPTEGGYRDGELAHVLERLLGYAAIEADFHVRTLLTTEQAATSHLALDYKLQESLATMPGEVWEQVRLARAMGGHAFSGDIAGLLRVLARRAVSASPATARLAHTVLTGAKRTRARLSSASR
ncbi:rhamnan synthesis F family protein [Agrococcus sp. Marseille-Q4369]|uniref:rhamnan synthesis F family protein n=1 Tax=Agrococcus sp. Marseille-Q4369 TaxID=2810513 RepID=UPI001B8BA543|nr:rhamnan synthesis F family protein [Agrococcus sp. Marseille-Q4369]QUW18563.1 hypothetical protein JSQ78_12310 [Agrococcus sp. Marseille-Q4369]